MSLERSVVCGKVDCCLKDRPPAVRRCAVSAAFLLGLGAPGDCTGSTARGGCSQKGFLTYDGFRGSLL